MNWTSILGIDTLVSRWRGNLNELAVAVEDRGDLAYLEWQQHKQSLAALIVLVVALGGLTVVVLTVLSMAMLVQFWDTPQRTTVAWCLAVLWMVAWGVALWRLLAAVKELSEPFRLTRNELKRDWGSLKERL